MCYQVCVYAACRCLYTKHAIDRCASYGRPGHPVQKRVISVDFACSAHFAACNASPGYRGDDDDLFSDGDSVFSDISKDSTAFSLPSDGGEDHIQRLFRDLLIEPQLEHLLPQVVRLSTIPRVAERNIARFLRRFSLDLRADSEKVPEFQASKYVRQCRYDIARLIVECHSVELEQEHADRLLRIKNSGDNSLEPWPGKAIEEVERLEVLYDDLTEFLFKGPAFESFVDGIRGFVEKSGAQTPYGRQRELIQGSNMLKRLVAKYDRPRWGRKRLWWTCACGRHLYDDYEEVRPGAFEDLQTFLSSYGRLGTSTEASQNTGADRLDSKWVTLTAMLYLPASFVCFVLSSSMFTWKTVGNDGHTVVGHGFATPSLLYWTSVTALTLVFCSVYILWIKRQSDQSDTSWESADKEEATIGSPVNNSSGRAWQGLTRRFRSEGSSRKDTSEPDLSDCSCSNALPEDEERHKFLLLCIPFMKWGLKLQQPDVCRIHSDRDFFKLLRRAYLEHRSGKRWKWLRRIEKLDFSQFELYHDSLVDIKATPSMPSFEARHEYEYEPPDTNPPIGPNLAMHLLENPDHAPVLPILVKRIPIKRKSRLQPCPVKGFSAGWGINFIEGVEGKAAFACALIGFILCLVAAVVWTVVRKDVQGGFGIGAFILAFSLFCSTKLHLLL